MSYKIVIPNGDDVPWKVIDLLDRMGIEYLYVDNEEVSE